ncbi:hypothetical protein QCA50_004677 [Cerrena zonata]|uniref:Tyr recombinase domain-containing protein n=1 Tax=Cerrena zonata TaxID=2478898 RepID=A0AAW0GNW2_9APHY
MPADTSPAKKVTSRRRHAPYPALSHDSSSNPSQMGNGGPSTTQLLQSSRLTTDEWYKAARTTKAYANYVKAGKKWLEDWVTEARDDGNATGSDREERIAFREAFDIIGTNTPTALRLYTAYKCEHNNLGFPTADGIRSAFKQYFELVHLCQGEHWRLNEHTEKWEGNPVYQIEYKAYHESLKNRDGRTGTSTQALPMHPNDLKVIFLWLDSPDAIKQLGELRILYFKAFAATAFTLWTRNDELINLQGKHFLRDQKTCDGEQYHLFTLIFRKTNKDPNKGQKYQIPLKSDMPEIDCFTYISTWVNYLEGKMRRPLHADDYIFPAIASTGKLKLGDPTSRTAIENLLDTVVDGSGVLGSRNGRFTTHCFRRGGAQYQFMWATRKWSLKAVKW